MEPEKRNLIRSLAFPSLFVLSMWAVKIAEIVTKQRFVEWGLHPLHWDGLPGILFSPLIHDDWSHLTANSGPMLVLGGVIFYFYRKIAYHVFFMIYLVTNVWVWFLARDAWHIGASGVVYGMASFVFTSGVLRRDKRLLALSLLVVFLYGSLIWGIFPQLFPDKNISWESHLMGLIAGVVTAFYYRAHGPEKKVYEWEHEEDETIPDWYSEDELLPPPEEIPPGQELPKKDPAAPQGTRVRYYYKPRKP